MIDILMLKSWLIQYYRSNRSVSRVRCVYVRTLQVKRVYVRSNLKAPLSLDLVLSCPHCIDITYSPLDLNGHSYNKRKAEVIWTRTEAFHRTIPEIFGSTLHHFCYFFAFQISERFAEISFLFLFSESGLKCTSGYVHTTSNHTTAYLTSTNNGTNGQTTNNNNNKSIIIKHNNNNK